MTTFRSPLVEIEQRVLRRAKDESLDLDADGTAARLGEMLADEVSRWSLDFKHGLRDYDLPDPELVVEKAQRNLTGYGPLEPLLADDDVWEIMINAPDQIFVKRHRGVSGYHDEAFHDDDHVIRTLTKILDDASTSHRKLDPSEGLQDAQLDSGARLHIVHRDIGRSSHLIVNIRKFTGVAFRSLDQLVERGMMTAQVGTFLAAVSRARLSTVFAGPPGSGKTTLLSCCTAELDPSLRVVTAEEVFEVDVPLPNVASMQTRAGRPDRPEVDLRRLVAGFLRMAPDVAIVGEVRDREALPLLLTLSSGVKGFTTIHAGSARQALSRLRFICQLADTRSELPMCELASGTGLVLAHDKRAVLAHDIRDSLHMTWKLPGADVPPRPWRRARPGGQQAPPRQAPRSLARPAPPGGVSAALAVTQQAGRGGQPTSRSPTALRPSRTTRRHPGGRQQLRPPRPAWRSAPRRQRARSPR